MTNSKRRGGCLVPLTMIVVMLGAVGWAVIQYGHHRHDKAPEVVVMATTAPAVTAASAAPSAPTPAVVVATTVTSARSRHAAARPSVTAPRSQTTIASRPAPTVATAAAAPSTPTRLVFRESGSSPPRDPQFNGGAAAFQTVDTFHVSGTWRIEYSLGHTPGDGYSNGGISGQFAGGDFQDTTPTCQTAGSRTYTSTGDFRVTGSVSCTSMPLAGVLTWTISVYN